jgi:hypothetical protein
VRKELVTAITIHDPPESKGGGHVEESEAQSEAVDIYSSYSAFRIT